MPGLQRLMWAGALSWLEGDLGVRGSAEGALGVPLSLCPSFCTFLALHRAKLQLSLRISGCGQRWRRRCFTLCFSFPSCLWVGNLPGLGCHIPAVP